MSSYTTIADGEIDVNSPVSEDLMTELRDNPAYLHERQLRVGTHATGTRRALAVGRSAAWTVTTSVGVGQTSVAVVFSTDAEDGDPNFDSAAIPIVAITLEEYESSSVDWATNAAAVTPYISNGTLNYQGFTVIIQVNHGSGTQTYKGYVHWTATAAVTSGE